MQPDVELKISGHSVGLSIDRSSDVLSFSYEHRHPGDFSLVQQFPLSLAADSTIVWDESIARFQVMPRKKPPRNSVDFEKTEIANQAELVAMARPSSVESRRASGDYIFWSDL